MRCRTSSRLGSLRWPKAAGVFSSWTQVPWAVRPCSFSRTTTPRMPMSGYLVLSMSRRSATTGSPVVVQLRIVDQHVAAAQDVVQLRDLQTVSFQVGDDDRFF